MRVWYPIARTERVASTRSIKTEVEVRFSAEGASTRVDLEHRLLHYYGEKAAQMRGIFDSEQGWQGLLDAFAARASAT
jgi:hypothetical protein